MGNMVDGNEVGECQEQETFLKVCRGTVVCRWLWALRGRPLLLKHGVRGFSLSPKEKPRSDPFSSNQVGPHPENIPSPDVSKANTEDCCRF